MSTLSIRLRYRPLRIGWCVEAGDFAALRYAMHMSCIMWGGSYNPIIPIGDPVMADALVKLYRVDLLQWGSRTEAVDAFMSRHPNLPTPFMMNEIYVPQGNDRISMVLDVTHPIQKLYEEYFKNNNAPPELCEIPQWDVDDPLSDVFLTTYGKVPANEDVGVDYENICRLHLNARPHIIGKGADLAPIIFPKISQLGITRLDMTRHYSVHNHWDHTGFYVGDCSNFDDLVNFWNLRAADISLQFYDPAHASRLAASRDSWESVVRSSLEQRPHSFGVGLWGRGEFLGETPLSRLYPKVQPPNEAGKPFAICQMSEHLWNGGNVRVPEMYFASASALAAVDEYRGKTTVTLPLPGRPFLEGSRNQEQKFVVAFDPGIGLYDNENATLHAPFIPAINEYLADAMRQTPGSVRAAPDNLGVIVPASAENLSLTSLDVSQLFIAIFKSVGITAASSKSGLVASRLIHQMGGLRGCRVFKIGGVRRLIEEHRPDQSFSKRKAMKTILGRHTPWPLDQYKSLRIEHREPGAELNNSDVLGYLLDRGVFRPGLNYKCPNCALEFWRILDDAKLHLDCEYCGHQFNSARQLQDKEWAFRRSGLFGRDDHQEGAIPVTLTLQQLQLAYHDGDDIFTTAMTLGPIMQIFADVRPTSSQ